MNFFLKDLTHKIQTSFFGFMQLVKAAPKETLILVSIVCLQAFLPSCSLLVIQEVINWISTPDTGMLLFPVVLVSIWGVLLLLETALNPVACVVRIHLNEKVIAHCTLLLMKKANSIEGLTPFEDPKLYDEIQFLKAEMIKRPLNFVYLITGFVKNIIGLSAILLVLSQLGLWIPIFVIFSCFPHALSTYWFQKQSWDQMLLRSPESRRMAWFASQTLDERASKEIRLFGFGDFFVNQYKILARSFHESFSKERWKKSQQSVALSILTVLGNLFTFILVIMEAKQGNVSTGTAVMALQALVMTQMQLNEFVQDIGLLIPSLLFFDKLSHFLNTQFHFLSQKGKKVISKPFPQTGICFDKVSFSYPDGRKVLSKVSFSIPVGAKVAIVGENGAGKSTLVKLLTRLYDPTEGRILIDGIDLREFDVKEWRQSLSVVFQDFGQYHLSAKDNIGISRSSFCIEEIIHAAQKGGFDSVVSRLPQGFDSLLGKEFGGTSLSGGEWQKIAMSRAFLREAEILILDEPTAALDPKSEHEVFQKFAENADNKMTFFITHRLGSVRMANCILVLKNGELIEEGSHEELMAKKGGEYAHLFSLQASRYALKET